MFRSILFWLLAVACSVSFAADYGLKEGKTGIQSTGALTFGPDGVLFVGDTKSGHVYAFATDDESADATPLAVSNLKQRMTESMKLGNPTINDLAIHPKSHAAYLSYSSSQKGMEFGIVRIAGESVKAFPIGGAKHAKIELTDIPAAGGEGRRNRRAQAITDMSFLDGSLLVAGVSNDGSKMRSISFPFAKTDAGSSIHIYHGAHGKSESGSPAQTFVPLDIGGEPSVVAAYICTPLVTYPVSAVIGDQEKIDATTVAELGNRNKPLDMVAYEKGGKQYLLLSNSARGVMKISAENVKEVAAIKDRVERGKTAGLSYDTIENMKGVVQLDRLDETRVVALIEDEGDLTMGTFDLP